MEFSDYIIFADESGSPVLDGADPNYPIFVLAFMLVRKETYTDSIVPALQRLKFDFVGHDQLILHERDIRRQSGPFAFLQVDKVVREKFLERINQFVEDAEIEIICSVIHKDELKSKYADPWSPYRIALHFCLEKLLLRLHEYNQKDRHVHCLFESRGAKEDKELELTFRRIVNNDAQWGWKSHNFSVCEWSPIFVDKKSNSAGLQIADLTARPLGLRRLRPDQPNRAVEIIEKKIPFSCQKWFP